tara:strand:+ start:195 stop:422 length:228 start_codon:yes stop_codon:yes gene_type:complete
MTAKEKAKELESWYWHKLYQIQSGITPTELAEQAKDCALICVDEVLELQLELAHDDNVNNIADFYKEVKQEINKL